MQNDSCRPTYGYRLATFSHRGYSHVGVEVEEFLIDLGPGYEHYKQSMGRRDFFKAKHGYTMLDVLEEWDLFVAALDDMVPFYKEVLSQETPHPPWIYRPGEIKFLPPVMFPNKVLNAGSNYYDHALEMGAVEPVKEGHEPYFFYKGSKHNLIGHGEPIRLTPRSNYVD